MADPQALPIISQVESGDRNIPGPTTDSGQAQGDYQITTGTWKDFAPRAGVDLAKYPIPLLAPKEVQGQVASVIPLQRWAPSTVQAVNAMGLDGGAAGASDALGTNRYGFINPLIGKMEQNQADSDKATAPIRDRMQKQLGEDMERVHKAADSVEPVDIQKWTTPPPKSDPIDGFGSIGAVFAGIASAFTHTPAINAMNGMAAAIEARKEGNETAYKQAYQAWKDNTELAIKRNEVQSKAFTQALDLMQTDVAAGHAALVSAASVYGDHQALLAAEGGLYGKVADAQATRDRMMMTWGIQMKRLEGGGTPGSPGYITNQLFNQIKQENPKMSDGDAWAEAERRQKAASKPAETPATQEERDSAAAQAATGMPMTQILPGWGASAVAARKQMRNDAIKKIQADTGMSAADAGVELANRTNEFQGAKRSSGQLTVMLGATKQAVSQLDFNISKAKEEMAKLGSSDLSPVINAIARGEEKWTGDPAYASTFFYMHAVAAESARILSGGQASVAQLHDGAMQAAQEWSNMNMTPASANAVFDAMHEEGVNRLDNFEKALKSQRVGQPPATPASPEGATPAKTEGAAAAPGAMPQVPPALAGKPLQWSPSLKQWRDKSSGKVYDANGTPGG